MKVLQSRSFERKVKKFSKSQKLQLDKQVKLIVEDPTIGTEKKGDLRGIHVHKFKIKKIQFLLSYRIVEEDLELIMIGPHQNYYRELKKYLKST
jgi:mRNA-degrading endonuclease RelE of RelBE toxin-antitoxin system